MTKTLVPATITGFTWTSGPAAAAQAAVDRLSRTVFRVGDSRIAVVRPDGRSTLAGALAADGEFRATSPDAEAVGFVSVAVGTTAVTLTVTEGAASYRATVGLRDATRSNPFGSDRAGTRG